MPAQRAFPRRGQALAFGKHEPAIAAFSGSHLQQAPFGLKAAPDMLQMIIDLFL
ncbi:hypothetical protein GSbR_38700 [Geobacter sp. SVR]|nr:hypothetical protein GSbR_38700 [Geobacter sp. SVR]